MTMTDMIHGLAHSNTHKFIVHGQKHKLWVLIFLVRTLRTKLSKLDEIFHFATKLDLLLNLVSTSSNGLGNKTIISCLFVVFKHYLAALWTT